MQAHQVLNPSHPHTFTHPITHISPHSHSLGGKDDSLSCFASMAKAGKKHQNQGEEKKDTSLHSSEARNIGMFMTMDTTILIDRSTLQSVYTWNHKITIIDGGHHLS